MTDRDAIKQALIEMIQREDVHVLDTEYLLEEMQSKNGYKNYQRTGVAIVTLLNMTVRAERQNPSPVALIAGDLTDEDRRKIVEVFSKGPCGEIRLTA